MLDLPKQSPSSSEFISISPPPPGPSGRPVALVIFHLCSFFVLFIIRRKKNKMISICFYFYFLLSAILLLLFASFYWFCFCVFLIIALYFNSNSTLTEQDWINSNFNQKASYRACWCRCLVDFIWIAGSQSILERLHLPFYTVSNI